MLCDNLIQLPWLSDLSRSQIQVYSTLGNLDINPTPLLSKNLNCQLRCSKWLSSGLKSVRPRDNEYIHSMTPTKMGRWSALEHTKTKTYIALLGEVWYVYRE